MSSSSEDDCYGNMSEKLQKMKDKYDQDKAPTAPLLDDSGELDEIVKNCPLPAKTKKKTKTKNSANTSENTENDLPDDSLPGKAQKKTNPKSSASTFDNTESTSDNAVFDLPDVSLDSTAAGASNKRVTRSSARKNNVEVNSEAALPPTRSKRQTKEPSAEASNTSVSRGRRGRGRGARGRGTPRRRGRGRYWLSQNERQEFMMQFFNAIIPNFNSVPINSSMPVYSVGNTDEYPDQSDSQTLFSSKKKTDEVVSVDDNELDDNEELSVKVYWQSSEFFKFMIRRFQKFTTIFDYFANKENVAHDKLLLTYNDKILKPDDTPESVGYSIVKFIDGGIVTQGVTTLTKKEVSIVDGIKLKFQCQNMKKPFEVTIRLDDRMSLAMMKCSEQLEKPLEKLRFEFDGDSIPGKSTARELEFEGGECIDVKILS